MPRCFTPVWEKATYLCAFGDTVKVASKGTARRDARFGIRRGRKDAKGQQSLESAATLPLGSMLLARFSNNLQRKIDLTNAFKSIFRDDSFKQCSKIAGFLGVPGGRAQAYARARASSRSRMHFVFRHTPTLLVQIRGSEI